MKRFVDKFDEYFGFMGIVLDKVENNGSYTQKVNKRLISISTVCIGIIL